MPSHRLRLLAGAASLLALSACATAPVAGPSAPVSPSGLAQPLAAETTTQLPRNAVPTHYRISVTPDAQAKTFTGKTYIDFDLLEPSTSVTLNAADLSFTSAQLIAPGGATSQITPSIDADKQTATLTFAKQMMPGHYQLAIDYAGKIYDQANGLFHLDYKNNDGQDKRALFTQFEAPDARRFVPSWDEPSYKARFDLTAMVPKGQMVVSNMPIATRTSVDANYDKVTFQTTPRMSTYLLFFGSGEFGRITDRVGNTEVGIVMGRGNEDKGRWALQSAKELLAYYNDYFGTPYPLPKLDNVAGPGQSQFFSAMENWGAIFSFESILLDDPKITSEASRQAIYAVNGHEMAHQWFGDLVTMSWWDDLWLNEGFASWMETKATADLHPEWETILSRVGGREAAMNMDAFKTTHPIVQKLTTVEQTSQAFDAITYSKGEAVIAMLENYAGSDVWRSGIRAYVKKHAYGNTVTNDLWSAVEGAGATGLTAIANDFTGQPGIPLIRVNGVTCANGMSTLNLTQGEFSRDHQSATPLRWNVPVIAGTVGATPARTIVSGGASMMQVPGCGTAIVNTGQAGYYRTLYTVPMAAALTRDFGKLAAMDQLGLLADQSALAAGGYQPYAIPLDMLNAVPANANTTVLASAAAAYAGHYLQFKGDTAAQAEVAEMAMRKFAPSLDRLGFDPIKGERGKDAILRNDLLGILGQMGDARINAEARRRFALLDSNPAALDGPMRTVWTSLIAGNADRATWDKIHLMAQRETNKQVRTNLYRMLASARDPALARAALELALTSEPGPTDSPAMISTVAYQHPEMALDFALQNDARVMTFVDVSSRSRYYARLGQGSIDPATIGKLEAYARNNLAVENRKPVEQAIAAIKARIETRKSAIPQIRQWYMAH